MTTTDEERQAVEAAVRRIYEAIVALVNAEGTDAIRDAWHHTPEATAKHPSGEWARGWDEVWTVWQIFESFGRPGTGTGEFKDLRVEVFGDFAFATWIFQTVPAWGGEAIMTSNVLRKLDGEWKVVHHHADRSPGMEAALDRMMAEG